MAAKARIIDSIGAGELLLADRIYAALEANDRIKYYLTALQAAVRHAERPTEPVPDLTAARDASGSDESWRDLMAESRVLDAGAVYLPGTSRLRALLRRDMATLTAPLRMVAGDSNRFDVLFRRLDAQLDAAASWPDDQLDRATIERLTGAGDETLHRLVMDVHKELNRLHAGLTTESIDGASASGMTEPDRALVRAFMAGLNHTAALKFDHPGLATTAARYGGSLSIQNDLGTTDAHVVVIRVAGCTATVVYSDVHRQRVQFLKDMLGRFPVEWHAGASPADGSYEVVVGTYTADDLAGIEQFLAFIGSRLVFVIDWNRARKQLKQFLPKDEAVKVLAWAADHDIGHRAFLEAGGAQLIYSAFERVAEDRVRFGARLDEVIGREAARSFLKNVLRITASALRNGQSERLIQDQIQAEWLSHTESAEHTLLGLAADHAGSIFAIAERLRHALARSGDASATTETRRSAELAAERAADADAIARRAARLNRRAAEVPALTRLIETADHAADALEEAAFLLTLLPEPDGPDGLAQLARLADLVGDGAREYVRCLECAKAAAASLSRADTDDVLVSADAIVERSRAIRAAARAAKAEWLTVCHGFRELQVLLESARGFERAADALARSGQLVRDHALAGNGVRP